MSFRPRSTFGNSLTEKCSVRAGDVGRLTYIGRDVKDLPLAKVLPIGFEIAVTNSDLVSAAMVAL